MSNYPVLKIEMTKDKLNISLLNEDRVRIDAKGLPSGSFVKSLVGELQKLENGENEHGIAFFNLYMGPKEEEGKK